MNAETLNFEMRGSIRFNKPLPNSNIISLGGYTMTMEGLDRTFDFEESEIQFPDPDSTKISFVVKVPDVSYCNTCDITESMLRNITEIGEFFVWIESDLDFEPVELLDLSFFLPDFCEEIQVDQSVLETCGFY